MSIDIHDSFISISPMADRQEGIKLSGLSSEFCESPRRISEAFAKLVESK